MEYLCKILCCIYDSPDAKEFDDVHANEYHLHEIVIDPPTISKLPEYHADNHSRPNMIISGRRINVIDDFV